MTELKTRFFLKNIDTGFEYSHFQTGKLRAKVYRRKLFFQYLVLKQPQNNSV